MTATPQRVRTTATTTASARFASRTTSRSFKGLTSSVTSRTYVAQRRDASTPGMRPGW
jgi:hypothetical protein